MLLSQIASALGADMDDYELPGDRIRQWFGEMTPPDPAERRLQIAAIVDAGLGELG